MKKGIVLLTAIISILVLSGCSMIDSELNDLNGHIKGNTYTIDTFDNFGTRTLKTHGTKIDIKPNVVTERTYNDGWGYTEALSSVITITIDGKQMISCGDTCIFYEDGLKPEYEFYLENIP